MYSISSLSQYNTIIILIDIADYSYSIQSKLQHLLLNGVIEMRHYYVDRVVV